MTGLKYRLFCVWDYGSVAEREDINQLSSTYQPFTGIINLRSTYRPFTGISTLDQPTNPSLGYTLDQPIDPSLGYQP